MLASKAYLCNSSLTRVCTVPTYDALGQFGGSPELAVAARSNVDHLCGRGAYQHSTAAHILLQRAVNDVATSYIFLAPHVCYSTAICIHTYIVLFGSGEHGL